MFHDCNDTGIRSYIPVWLALALVLASFLVGSYIDYTSQQEYACAKVGKRWDGDKCVSRDVRT